MRYVRKCKVGAFFSYAGRAECNRACSVSVYERDGKYQLYAKEIILDGAGALYERFEALKKELEEMGMFAAEYKQPIPRYVKSVGIVTAPTGAAVRDIINISKRRNPYVQLIFISCTCTGRRRSCKYRPWNPDDGTTKRRCDHCRTWRRLNGRFMGI